MQLKADNKDAIILAIDDSKEMLWLLEEILKTAGFKNIISSVNPKESAELYLEHNPDVVLLDLNMPGMGGFEVISELKDKCNDEYLPIIVITAEEEVKIKVEILQHGAIDCIGKPFDHFEILARVNTVVSMSSFYKELALKNRSLNSIVNEQTSSLMTAIQKQQKAEQELQNTMLHDNVTGLPNRYLFEDRLEQLIESSKRNNTRVAVLVVGFDNHYEISNTIGHSGYDKLLKEIAHRLKSILRTSDTVSIMQDASSGTALSRISEDIFAVIVPIFQTLVDIDKVIAKCEASLLEPMNLPDILFDIKARSGVSYFPDHGDSPDVLIQNANVALYHAREKLENYTIYDVSFDSLTKYRMNLMADLKKAINDDALELYYQPKIDLTNDTVIGVEALLRWTHPEYGFIAPDNFIPMAEKTGTIRLVTVWVINRAMQQWAEWQDKGIHLNISINLSTHDLKDKTFVENVKNCLEKYKVNPNNIILEVTENSTMQDPATSMKTLDKLSALGVKLSIDDYGTGYSSLSYLKSLPVDEIKIDKSFVMTMDKDKHNSIIVNSTIELAHNLGYSVVAEGIENDVIYAVLQAYNCNIGQGFHMSRPLPSKELEKWLLERKEKTTNIYKIQ